VISFRMCQACQAPRTGFSSRNWGSGRRARQGNLRDAVVQCNAAKVIMKPSPYNLLELCIGLCKHCSVANTLQDSFIAQWSADFGCSSAYSRIEEACLLQQVKTTEMMLIASTHASVRVLPKPVSVLSPA